MSILLNWVLFPFSNIWVPLVGSVSIGVKPVYIIFGGVGTPPTLHRGVEPTVCLSYGIFRNPHAYGRGLQFGILGASQGRERWTFPVHPGGCIFLSLDFSARWHEYHWCLFYWIFISRIFRSYCILLHYFRYNIVVFLWLKATAQASRFYWGSSPRHAHEFPVLEDSTFWLYCCFYCYDIIFWFHLCVSKQENPLVFFVVGFCWWFLGKLVPLLISRTP